MLFHQDSEKMNFRCCSHHFESSLINSMDGNYKFPKKKNKSLKSFKSSIIVLHVDPSWIEVVTLFHEISFALNDSKYPYIL